MAIVVISLVLFAVIGFAVNRLWTLLIPVVVWPLLFLGLQRDWWGDGLGDGWQFGLAFGMAAGVIAAAIGVLVRKANVPVRIGD